MNENTIYIIDKEGMVDVLKRRFEPRSRPKGGAESVFIPITKTIALKGFVTKGEARSAMRRQKKAAKLGLGPDVITNDLVEVIMPVGGTYLSSRLDWLALRKAPKYKKKHRRLYAYKTQIVTKVFRNSRLSIKNKAKYKQLTRELHENGLSVSDLHYLNVGMIGEKMVCIDFGNLSS